MREQGHANIFLFVLVFCDFNMVCLDGVYLHTAKDIVGFIHWRVHTFLQFYKIFISLNIASSQYSLVSLLLECLSL